MFSAPKDVEELRRLFESDVPVLAFAFKRRADEGWAPEHSHARGQFVALTRGLLIVEAGNERWIFPSQRCAWIPPDCMHKARSVGGAAGSMVYLSADMCRGLPKKPCMFSSSELCATFDGVKWDVTTPSRLRAESCPISFSHRMHNPHQASKQSWRGAKPMYTRKPISERSKSPPRKDR
jgi:hypothetical protein